MTHYPTEDKDDILRQLARFDQDTDWLKANGLPPGPLLRHTANTFATLHHPQTRLDMVRVGGALYGDTSADFLARFRPTITLKSRVAAVNHFPADETVAYDRTYRLDPRILAGQYSHRLFRWLSPQPVPCQPAGFSPMKERTTPRC